MVNTAPYIALNILTSGLNFLDVSFCCTLRCHRRHPGLQLHSDFPQVKGQFQPVCIKCKSERILDPPGMIGDKRTLTSLYGQDISRHKNLDGLPDSSASDIQKRTQFELIRELVAALQISVDDKLCDLIRCPFGEREIIICYILKIGLIFL